LNGAKVRYFHNNRGQGFEDWSDRAGFAAAGTGWWNSIAAADFNGDGRPDYVVGNVGPQHGVPRDPDHPALLYYGDFRGDGEAASWSRPTTRGTSSIRGAPAGTWGRDPGDPEALSQERLLRPGHAGGDPGRGEACAAQRFAATEFRSGVFLSQPDGTYRFEPLPRIAQISPIQGLVAGDFDGDGNADIYAVQNSYSPIPSSAVSTAA
jgi:enediyne biosynthesis protein E4